ncbi:MAG: 3-deoxy-D-manno-octulosonic acid transferase [Planctomycetota bacterium]
MRHIPLLLLTDAAYLLGLVILSPWLLWRALFRGKYRRYLLERFGSVPRREPGARPLVWLHAVSVGEVMATPPLVAALEQTLPTHEVAISASTETGRDAAARLFPTHVTFQYPQDLSFAVWRALRRLRPAVVLLMELEVWPNFMRLCEWQRVPVIVVNGRMTDRSCRGYARFRWLLGGMFRRLRLVLAQTDAWAANFVRAGVPADRIQVCGSVKYDALAPDTDIATVRAAQRKSLGVRDDELVWVAGSTHPPEHEVIIRVWQTLRREGRALRLILVPRHPEKPEPWRYLDQHGIAHARLSAPGDAPAPADTVIVGDVIGTLAGLYASADIAFVGKSLDVCATGGGQNPLEPAALGVPVLFGEKMRNFAAPAADLLARGAATRVTDEAALLQAMRELCDDADRRAEAGAAARAAVQAGRGASPRMAQAVAAALRAQP